MGFWVCWGWFFFASGSVCNSWGGVWSLAPALAGVSFPDERRSLCPGSSCIPPSWPPRANVKFGRFCKCLNLIPAWVKPVTAASSQVQIKVLL